MRQIGAPQTHGGVPQLPTRDEYLALKALRKQMQEQQGSPVAITNGGTIIADAYTSV